MKMNLEIGFPCAGNKYLSPWMDVASRYSPNPWSIIFHFGFSLEGLNGTDGLAVDGGLHREGESASWGDDALLFETMFLL